MKSKKEEKYIVINKKRLENYLSQFTKGKFTTEDEQNNIDCLTFNEVLRGVDNDSKYIVCNQDEPYAELIWQIILMGEDSKELERMVT